jgi:AraC-like DNA-binding protein
MSSRLFHSTFFRLAEQVDHRRRRNASGTEMFSDVRFFQFADPVEGWLQTDHGSLADTGMSLWRVRSTGHTVELSEPEYLTVLVPTSGRIGVEVTSQRFGASAGSSLLFGPNRRRTNVYPAGSRIYDAAVMLIPVQSMAPEASRGLGNFAARGDPGLITFATHLFSELRRNTSPLHGKRAQLASASLLLDYVGAAIAFDGGDGAAGQREILRAEEIMRERFHEPLTISAVAREAGLSERSLQLAYRRFRDITPREALTRIRMEAARLRLLGAAPGETVSQIALDCGFAHLGRFSTAYGSFFGELPSQTMRRSKWNGGDAR